MKIKLSNLLRLLLGLGIVIITFYVLGFNNIVQAIVKVNIFLFLIGFLIYGLRNFVITWRLQLILKNFGCDISLRTTFWAHMGGIVVSDYTPSRSGYLYASLILKRKNNIPYQKSLSGIISSNAIEFILKTIGAALAIFYIILVISPDIPLELYFTLIFATSIMLTVTIVLTLILWWEKGSNFFSKFEKLPYLKKIFNKIQDIQQQSKEIKPIFWKVVIISLLIWILKGFTWLFFFFALNIFGISLIECILLQPLITALAFIPLFPSGFGIQEIGTIFILGIFNVSSPLAGAFSVLLRSMLVFNLLGIISVFDILRTSHEELESINQLEV